MDARSTTLVGRDRELEVLEQALSESAEPGTRAVMVRGEAGIGKSALLEQFLARTAERGTQVVAGRAQAVERGIPYAAVHHAIARLAPHVGPETRRLVERLSRAIGAPSAAGGPVDERLARALDAALDLIGALAAHRSVVLAVDDLHAADEETLALVGALARRSVGLPVLLVITLRSDLAQASAAVERFLAEVEVDCRASVLELAPLSREGVARVLENLGGEPPSDEVAQNVYERSGGNAFFVAELGAGFMPSPDQTVRPSRRTAVIQRLLPPDPEALPLAKVLSAAGGLQLSELPAAGAVARLPPEASQATFDGLVRARLLVATATGGYAFRHEILREAVYDELGPAERRRIHTGLAEELIRLRDAGRDVDPVTIAHHAMTAADGPDETVAGLAQAAADRMRSFAPRSAATWYEHSLRLTPPGSAKRPVRLARHAHALINAGLFAEGIAKGREALAHELDQDERVRCVATVAEALTRRGEPEALDLIEQEIEQGCVHPRLLISRMLALTTQGRFDEAEEAARQARARTADSPKDHALAIVYSTVLAGAQGHIEEVDRFVDEAVRRSANLARHVQRFIYGFAASLLAQEAQVSKAEEMLAHVRELGDDEGAGIDERVEMAQVLLAFYRGDWDAVLVRVSRLTNLQQETSSAPGLPFLQHVEATIRASRGDLTGARQVAQVTAAAAPPYVRVEQHATSAWIELLDRRPAAAWQECDRCEASVARMAGTTSVTLAVLRAQAAHMLGDTDAAGQHLSECVAAEDGSLGPRLQLEALLARAEVTRDISAARRANDVAAALSLPFYEAQALLLRGHLDDEPETTLTAAWRGFRALGAEVWRGRAAGALRARQLPVPRARRSTSDDLTDLEREIVMLVYEGLSNEKIAERLSYSRHSITAYLGRIYAKTGCASRLDLVRAVTEGVLG